MPEVARFDGKVAIVTGGSNGLGRAITEAFANAGARVLICDLAMSDYFAGREDVVTVVADIADPATPGIVLDAAISRWSKADILVNDAASYPNATLLDTDKAAWERVFAVNVTGTFQMTQAFARHCLAREATDSAVVSISTGSARNPRPAGAAYAASKAAVETMSKVFAMELGPYGIRVNLVAPGYIDVRGWSQAFPDRASDEMRARLVASIPLGRSGHPTDIANAVLFLASDAASHITGTVLEVDGGSNAGRLTLAPSAGGRSPSVRG
jgi:NAD(P)-dependent dehydrogenase (short-subunit alcohol dehydrogenase family)